MAQRGQEHRVIRGRRPVPTDPETACSVLVQSYDDGAGTEALLRAFLAERDRNRPAARFLIEVYGLVAERSM